MNQINLRKPLALAVGVAITGSLASASVANASPFSLTALGSAYMAAGDPPSGDDKAKAEGKCGADKAKAEGSCGADKAKGEGKCGEGKCGANMKEGDKDKEGTEKKEPAPTT